MNTNNMFNQKRFITLINKLNLISKSFVRKLEKLNIKLIIAFEFINTFIYKSSVFLNSCSLIISFIHLYLYLLNDK